MENNKCKPLLQEPDVNNEQGSRPQIRAETQSPPVVIRGIQNCLKKLQVPFKTGVLPCCVDALEQDIYRCPLEPKQHLEYKMPPNYTCCVAGVPM